MDELIQLMGGTCHVNRDLRYMYGLSYVRQKLDMPNVLTYCTCIETIGNINLYRRTEEQANVHGGHPAWDCPRFSSPTVLPMASGLQQHYEDSQ